MIIRGLKKFVLIILASGFILFAYIWLGSIDTGNAPQIEQIQPVDDSRNGFSRISYLESEESILTDEQRESIRKQITQRSVDDSLMQIVANKSDLINDYISAADQPDFQIAMSDDPQVFPRYINLMDAGRLTLLKSREAADRGDFGEATLLTTKALIMAERVKSEKNAILISFFIGVAMQNEALRWANFLSQSYPLSPLHQRQILQALYSMPDFHQDGFKEVFAGEYQYSVAITDDILNAPFNRRWQAYRDDADYWNTYLGGDPQTLAEKLKRETYSLLSAILPHFYVHRNELLTEINAHYEQMTTFAQLYCNQVPADTADTTSWALTWVMLVKPNAGTEVWKQQWKPHFYDYFIRRCLSQANIEATKTLVALRLFNAEVGRHPANLAELAPDYLNEIPIDPFDGNSLRYSSKERWVSSVGDNFSDEGGSLNSCFTHPCFSGEPCAQNPTFPLDSGDCITQDQNITE